jgi:hypothetical protein
MILLKLFEEWGEGGIKENGRRGEFKYDIFYIRIFTNPIMYPCPAQQ